MRNLEPWVLAYLANSLWQVPLLFMAGWLAVRVLRRAGPRAEHCVWVGVLLMQTFVPAISVMPAGWLKPLFTWAGRDAHAAQAGVTVRMGSGITTSTLLLPTAVWALIAIAYASATLYFAFRFLWRYHQLSTLRDEAQELELDGEERRHWVRCVEGYRVVRPCVAVSSRIFGPVTMGMRRPMVLLPVHMAASLCGADLRTVIEHEFAHMQRHDFLKNLVYEVISLPISFHPVLWLTREHIIESREMVCDQMAAQAAGRNEYARSLLRLASRLVQGASIRNPHAIGIFDANQLERRLMRLTGNQKDVRGLPRIGLIALCAGLAIAACGSALALSLHVDAGSAASSDNNAKAPAAINVSPGEMAGNLLQKVPPQYPIDAKKAHIQGTVVLAAVIGKDGQISKLRVVSGPKELQKSSLDAVRQWSYKPYLLNGEPVEVKTTINVIYSLGK